jgi:hypothetical protein
LARAPLIVLIKKPESGGATRWVWLERALPGFSIDAIVNQNIILYTFPAAVAYRRLENERDGFLRSPNVRSAIEFPAARGKINPTTSKGY